VNGWLPSPKPAKGAEPEPTGINKVLPCNQARFQGNQLRGPLGSSTA